VTKLAALEARNAMMGATSLGLPNRPSGAIEITPDLIAELTDP
jgi:hypothetical protein